MREKGIRMSEVCVGRPKVHVGRKHKVSVIKREGVAEGGQGKVISKPIIVWERISRETRENVFYGENIWSWLSHARV